MPPMWEKLRHLNLFYYYLLKKTGLVLPSSIQLEMGA